MTQETKQPKSRKNGQKQEVDDQALFGSRRAREFQTGSTSVIGTTGLRVIAGRVQEEYLVILKSWQRATKIYLEMLDDVTIGTMLDALKLPLLKAKFEVLPANPNIPGDIAAAEWLDKTMRTMEKQTWKSHVQDALETVEWGFAIGEIILEKREDGKLWLKNIDPRGQETLERWEWEKDKAVTFVQRDPVSQKESFVPLEKSIHFTFKGRKGNPMGTPLLRSVYRSWRFKKDLENLEGIGIERDVGGMPIAKIPKDGNISTADITKLKAALEALRMDEAMYLIGPEGVEISGYGGGSKMYDVALVIDIKKKEILGRVFSQFLMLGMSEVGTQALVKGSQDFFTLALEALQEMLLEGWNLQLVPYLFGFNSFPGMTGLPKIIWLPPGKEDVAAISGAISTLISAKVLTPTDDLEDIMRDILNLPELPPEERGEPREPEAPAFDGNYLIRKKVE